ncbi:MAG: type I DNA topoisomerase [Patescibacteria group bacterium]
MDLVIVESPTKSKTISKFLGKDYQVESSYGHVRDLPKSKLGVDLANNFEPEYVISPKAKQNLKKLNQLAKKADSIILATDEDREGEAIAWHLAEALGLGISNSSARSGSAFGGQFPISKQKLKSQFPKIQRIVFHEITRPAIEQALENPREINLDLVNAQQARRVLDRLVGYELSPFLWKKIKYGLSAGRVQSAALRLLVEKEKEIQEFKPVQYFPIRALVSKLKSKDDFEAFLFKINEKNIPNPGILSAEQAKTIVSELEKAEFSVFDLIKKQTSRSPSPPFTTSTLQQDAWQKLRYSSKQTMMIAQQLYEQGLITYMRTDSVNLSQQSINAARKLIQDQFGKNYLPEKPNFYKAKSKLAQEAHEAIRPTNPFLLPEELKQSHDSKQAKLYQLIWSRFIACQMGKAKIAQQTVIVLARYQDQSYFLKTTGQQIIFDGFLKVANSSAKEVFLPELKKEEVLELKKILSEEKFTQPPARYNDASLVKMLEQLGIGRPSTYSSIISTLLLRNYVQRTETRSLQATSLGILVTELLVNHFQEVVDYKFTARIEDDLDEIANKGSDWRKLVKNFYGSFHENLLKKEKEVSRQEATERPSDEVCDKCGAPMVVKYGRYGEFLGCSRYPDCSNIKKLPKQNQELDILCPECGKEHGGKVVIRRTKAKKRVFYGCSRWPECNFMSWKKPVNE